MKIFSYLSYKTVFLTHIYNISKCTSYCMYKPLILFNQLENKTVSVLILDILKIKNV